MRWILAARNMGVNLVGLRLGRAVRVSQRETMCPTKENGSTKQ